MLSGLLKKIFGDKNEKALKELWPIVHQINEKYEQIKDLSDDELRAKTQEFKEIINERTKELREKIAGLNAQLQQDELPENVEEIRDEIEELEKEELLWQEKLKEKLKEKISLESIKNKLKEFIPEYHPSEKSQIFNLSPTGKVELH